MIKRTMKKTRNTLSGLVAGVFLLGAGGAQAADDVMIVFDGSNSMWGQIDGTAKIEIARDAMNSLMGEWVEGTNVGLMAYGHRREGDCTDIETILPPGPVDRGEFMGRVRGITPRGKTPLSAAIESAAETLSYRDNPATVVVITDGIETCGRDPCALAEELNRRGVRLTAHVVGFDLSGDGEQEAVACIAEHTGGRFLPAGDADELGQALSEIGTAVAEAAEPEPEPEPEPAPVVELTAPPSATVGSSFVVSWSASEQHARDYVTIVPMGADEGETGDYSRVGNDTEGKLQAPATPGLYEVRYVLNEGKKTLASEQIEIVEADVSVSAPDSATTGSSFAVSWSAVIHGRDYVTIVPMGADEGETGNYSRVGNDTEGNLQAPAMPGLYEVRYVLNEGKKTLASEQIEIVEADVSVSAPDSATTGSSFAVSWSAIIHGRDYVTIVPMGADEGETGNYSRVGNDTEGKLQAPATPGLYEVRYVLNEGKKTLASEQIEIVEADIELSGPGKVRAGSDLRVEWSGTPPSGRDYVTIVPLGADEGESGPYQRAGDQSRADLAAPEETGLYEVRYVLNEGRRTIARHRVEVVGETETLDTGGSLTVPGTGAPGETVEVSWSAGSGSEDQRIALATADQAEFTWIEAQSIEGEPPLRFTLPDEPGRYEFRLLDLTEGKVLSRAVIEVE